MKILYSIPTEDPVNLTNSCLPEVEAVKNSVDERKPVSLAVTEFLINHNSLKN